MSRAVFVTGATGTIGRELVPHLLQGTDADVVLLLHKQGLDSGRSSLLREIFSVPADMGFAGRLRILAGDISQPDLGLSSHEYRELTQTTTDVLHLAAATRFDLPLGEARRINVTGTEEVIRLAQRCVQLERFGFVSTAYVAGKRTGVINERERSHAAGFVNSYEQSKYEAEARLEKVRAHCPIAVYRLSTVLGDSRTGRVAHITAPHQALRLMHLGLVAMLPGSPNYRVDLVPSDFTASVLARLFLYHFQAGQVFHITASEDKAYTLEEIVNESYRYLAELDLDWGRRRYPKPVIASFEAFDLFLRSAEETNNPIMQGVMRTLRHFAYQLAYPKRFDRTTVLSHLPDYDADLPDIRGYYREIVRYCLNTGWRPHA